MFNKRFGAFSSSADPAKLSLTIKAIAASLLPVIHALTGVEIVSKEVDKIIDAVFTLLAQGFAVYGYIRSKKE